MDKPFDRRPQTSRESVTPRAGGPEQVSTEDMKKIVHDGDPLMLNDTANRLGRDYAEGGIDAVSTSQLRNVLDHLQRMHDFKPRELHLLRPKLAYTAGRSTRNGRFRKLQEVTDKAIRLVENRDHFENFRNFFEAIVAYHRYHGGK